MPFNHFWSYYLLCSFSVDILKGQCLMIVDHFLIGLKDSIWAPWWTDNNGFANFFVFTKISDRKFWKSSDNLVSWLNDYTRTRIFSFRYGGDAVPFVQYFCRVLCFMLCAMYLEFNNMYLKAQNKWDTILNFSAVSNLKREEKVHFGKKFGGGSFCTRCRPVDKCIYALKMQTDATKTSAINDSRACPQRRWRNNNMYLQYL